MKMRTVIFRWSAVLLLAAGSVSCVTTYDAAGRPVQTVDPVVATAGIAAAGLIGYAIAQDNGHSNHHYHGGYYGRPCYY
jgi:hypothetical protein